MESSTSRPQYDSLLGGRQNLPPSINVGDFVAARLKEITALTEVIGKLDKICEDDSKDIGFCKA